MVRCRSFIRAVKFSDHFLHSSQSHKIVVIVFHLLAVVSCLFFHLGNITEPRSRVIK